MVLLCLLDQSFYLLLESVDEIFGEVKIFDVGEATSMIMNGCINLSVR